MCGIAGYFNYNCSPEKDTRVLEQMIYPLSHRGPDGFGFFQDKQVGLAHARLSIVDLEGGWQPIHNERKTLWIIFNGEIFNYPELREALVAKGHRFYTNSDTEVIIHLYEEKKENCVNELNGQFAFAIYDAEKKTIFIARDRMGIRPLFYTVYNGRFFFGSEIKALFSGDQSIKRSLNPQVLGEIFTFWSPGGEETVFQGVKQLEPGHWMLVEAGGLIQKRQYWDIPLHQTGAAHASESELTKELRSLLVDSVRLRLRADVPVGAYLSGGLDSSIITSLIHHYTDNPLKTFSVGFRDAVYDEENEQNEVVSYLKTDHKNIRCSYASIAENFEKVIWHTETPILRTAPTPLYLLSGLVRENEYKVVLTGEGADEVFGGYDIFKEAKVRAFIGREADSSCRPFLLKRLYPYLALSPTRSASFAKEFFETDIPVDSSLFYGHGPRWKTGDFLARFFSTDMRKTLTDPRLKLARKYDNVLQGMDFFSRTQYVESKLLLANYLLSSQGDRMGMANSVEGRFPFLDHRVVEFASRLPVQLRMKGLNEKYLLKKAMADILPLSVVKRKKQPYMAPDILSFFADREADYLSYYLSDDLLRESNLFSVKAVHALVNKCRKKARQGFRENMALVGILSTQILYHHYIKEFSIDVPEVLTNTKVVVA